MWQKLEAAILNKYCNTVKDSTHVWVITGPIFSDHSQFLTRDNGVRVAIPDSFYCILVRPFRHPFDAPTNAQYLSFIFAQDLPKPQPLTRDFLVSIDRIEQRTRLNFFPRFTASQQNRIETAVASRLW